MVSLQTNTLAVAVRGLIASGCVLAGCNETPYLGHVDLHREPLTYTETSAQSSKVEVAIRVENALSGRVVFQ